MELTNEFRVGIPKTEAWKILTDVERIAPFLPGAQLQEVEGDEYRGVVKVKVGPITAQYKGTARFLEREEDAGRVVLSASGRDTRGQGNATATITATMIPEGEGTLVKVVTDLRVTGKVAQFGRGVLADVSSKLLGQFVEALEADLAGSQEEINRREAADESAEGNSSGATVDSGAFSSEPRPIEAKEVEPVNLLSVAGSSVLRQVLPLLAGATGVILIVLGRRWIRRFRAPRQ